MINKNLSEVDFGDEFEVSPGIRFGEDYWKIKTGISEHCSFRFNDILDSKGERISAYPDLKLFVKILTYYMFPDSVLHNGRSWDTAHSYFRTLGSLIREFFAERFFVSKDLIRKIDGEQIRAFLDHCARSSEHSALHANLTKNITRILNIWISASETGAMPEWCRANFVTSNVVSKQFKSTQKKLCDDERELTWTPLSAHQIRLGYESAYDYIYKFSDAILEAHYLIYTRPRKLDGNLTSVRKDGMTKELFQRLLKFKAPTFPGTDKKVFDFTPKTQKVKSHGYKSGYQDRTTIDINIVRPELINLKRACIFIIGLLTGLRKKEIAYLKVNATFARDGQDYLYITRFKTASNPRKGTPDNIPVPRIVVDAIQILENLFKHQRKELESEYLLVSDIITVKRYSKIKINTIGKDVRKFLIDFTGEDGHTHQLRKTIAWLLISQGEENIDLIRQLFGHKSYGMTLRYILRNELLSGCIKELLEKNYTEDLHQALSKIASGEAVGDLANKLRQRSIKNYPGQILASEIEAFVHSALESGVPLFISRIPIGGFCINSSDISKKKPPCIDDTDEGKPNPEFCDYLNCPHVLHTSESVENVKSQISFYEKKQKHLPEFGDDRIQHYYESKIQKNKKLLEQLSARANIIIATDSETKNG